MWKRSVHCVPPSIKELQAWAHKLVYLSICHSLAIIFGWLWIILCINTVYFLKIKTLFAKKIYPSVTMYLDEVFRLRAFTVLACLSCNEKLANWRNKIRPPSLLSSSKLGPTYVGKIFYHFKNSFSFKRRRRRVDRQNDATPPMKEPRRGI